MIRLVLSDIDNTLIPFGNAHANKHTLQAIHTCQDAGVVFGPATGRNRPEVATFLCDDAASYATGVFVNGQQVFLNGRLVNEVSLDPTDLRRAVDIVCSRKHCALIVFRPNGHADWVGDDRDALGPLPNNAMLHGETHQAALPIYPVVKAGVIAYLERDEELALKAELEQACPHLGFANTVPQWFDVVPHGWSKADGIEMLMRALGVSPNETCVFGDAENDLAMMERVRHSCAVANATPSVLAAARWHVGASAEDGVAAALQNIAQGLNPDGSACDSLTEMR